MLSKSTVVELPELAGGRFTLHSYCVYFMFRYPGDRVKGIFYVPCRINGLDAEPFKMVKFRTMSDEQDADGMSLPDEERLSRLGHFLRATSLDELPELWNVLRGDMSLVGPRPLLMEYLDLYTPEQARRHTVRPGITGWAQVNGRNALTWSEKFELDLWYVDNRSFWLDLKILWLTLMKVLSREGISHDGHATMEPFRGTQD